MAKPNCTKYYSDDEKTDEKSALQAELNSCATWYDGCNTCMVKYGKILGCTKMYCAQKNKPYCKKKIDEPKVSEDLKNCTVWYDGCNTCSVTNGKLGACTLMACFR